MNVTGELFTIQAVFHFVLYGTFKDGAGTCIAMFHPLEYLGSVGINSGDTTSAVFFQGADITGHSASCGKENHVLIV